MGGPADDLKREVVPALMLQPDPYEPDDDESIENVYEANADAPGPVDGEVGDHWT